MSAICFNLDQPKILLSGNGLRRAYGIILIIAKNDVIITEFLLNPSDFKRPWERGLLKTLWENKKMLETSIFFFSYNVFYPSQNNLNIQLAFILSSANALNLFLSKILGFFLV